MKYFLGYVYEGANWVCSDPANHAVHGPMTDQVFAYGNFFVNPKLRAKAEAGIGEGYNRAKKGLGIIYRPAIRLLR